MALTPRSTSCAEVEDSEQAIRAAMREQPDLCLVGDHIAGNGLAAVRGICRAAPNAAVVVLAPLATSTTCSSVFAPARSATCPARSTRSGCSRVVRAAANNEAVVPRAMVLELVLELRGGGGGADALTARESQVLGMLRRGHKASEIAERLSIAPVTVRRHISELVRKLGVEDRAALTVGAAPGLAVPFKRGKWGSSNGHVQKHLNGFGAERLIVGRRAADTMS